MTTNASISVPTMTVKISVYNGDTKLKFSYSSSEFCENKAKTFVFDTLSKIVENQEKLKKLGTKGNFFGLSAYKENFIDIDIVQDNEVETFASGITFKFSQLQRVDDKRQAFDLIFDTQSYLKQNSVVIE